mgnify:CR=1 FL=1
MIYVDAGNDATTIYFPYCCSSFFFIASLSSGKEKEIGYHLRWDKIFPKKFFHACAVCIMTKKTILLGSKRGLKKRNYQNSSNPACEKIGQS